jgi:peroxiredoxin
MFAAPNNNRFHMKSMVYILSMIAFISGCNNQKGYQLKGTIDGLAGGDIILLEQRIDKNYIAVDSVTTVDGTFEFSGRVSIPDVYYISVPGRRGKAILFLENSPMSFTARADSLWKPAVTGSAVHDEYISFQASISEIYEKAGEIYADYREADQAGDVEKATKLEEEIDAVYDQVEKFQVGYLDENPASYIAPYIVQNLHYGKEADEIEAMLDKLAPALDESSLVGNITRRMEVLKKVAIGMPAPEFIQDDSLGNPVSLSSFRGKYLLIDFWAAWCGPCRGENPNVVKAYQKFSGKGFDILGVSLDNARENWLKAVHDDSLTWTHVSDLRGWSNEVAAMYGISSIPSNLLLDPEGIIIKKNLRGGDLHLALEELMP